MPPLPRTAFARALEIMNSEERARAQRLQSVFNLREDDAIWELCGLTKRFDMALRDIPQQCSTAADRVARWELAPQGAHSDTGPSAGTGDERMTYVVSCSAFVLATVLVGCSCFTVGATLHTGSAYWAPNNSLTHGGVAYLLQAIWTAPVAGHSALIGLILLAVVAAVRRLWRAALPCPPRGRLGH